MQQAYGKLQGSRFAIDGSFLGLRVAIIGIFAIALASGTIEPTQQFLTWLGAYTAITLVLTVAKKEFCRFSWSCLLVLIPDTFFVIKMLTSLGSLEVYLVYAYFILIALSSLQLGLKGGLATAAFISIFDYIYTKLPSGGPYLYSPILLRIGLVWLGALVVGLSFRRLAENQKKIQQLNDELDSKVTVLVSASRVLGSINDLNKLILYFQETIGRIFGIDEQALVIKSEHQIDPIIISNIGINETGLSESLFKVNKEALAAGAEFKNLGLAIGATHKGTQGLYLLVIRSSELQVLLADKDVFNTTFSQFILAIDNALLMRKAKDASLTDHLTGLYNQRYFYERMTDEIKRAQRTMGELSLLIIDVDNFKAYNDQHGHLSGDKALSIIAGVISDCCRETDVPCRYGGEEFVVILPDSSSKEASVVADRIMQDVRSAPYPITGGKRYDTLTVSIGIASYPNQGTEPLHIIEQADRALYKAKSLGKNQAVTARKKRADANNSRQRKLRGA